MSSTVSDCGSIVYCHVAVTVFVLMCYVVRESRCCYCYVSVFNCKRLWQHCLLLCSCDSVCIDVLCCERVAVLLLLCECLQL